ncbi:alpha-amylase family glycosyl hydrolase [Chitinophaga pinensis]|uniref:alpha-amylase family glycosyl hydrolase n=1 Tax=Chitinophaga pinensis TaxID=79329 RepID=UPI0039656443
MFFPVYRKLPGRWIRKATYYFHRFHEFEPDLTQKPCCKRGDYTYYGLLVKLGVAGFRVDAVPLYWNRLHP